MKKQMCCNGHLNDENANKCSICGDVLVYSGDECDFLQLQEEKIYMPDHIIKSKAFISDMMITRNFIKIFRYWHLSKIDIKDLPNAFFNYAKEKSILRIELCYSDFWEVICVLIQKIDSKFEVPECASDVLVMKELISMLESDWIDR